jgi:hypothetical protein
MAADRKTPNRHDDEWNSGRGLEWDDGIPEIVTENLMLF